MAQFRTDLKKKIEPFRKLKDKTAKATFAFGGFFIIISIFLIVFFIGKEAVPLFKSYQVDSKKNFVTNSLAFIQNYFSFCFIRLNFFIK